LQESNHSYRSLTVVVPKKNYKEFKGSRVFVDKDSRKALPFLTPDEMPPVWKIIKGVIG